MFRGLLNPNSIFCLYKIYKQSDNTYQVWWRGKVNRVELSNATYEQAKAFQVKECQELKEFMFQSPKGKIVK